ncbi:ABC transporter ATP-binding protein [Corynebacterium nasicanis]|uniref:ABC transporter ATP-binding protein n=1 Tax=Corynebacterium nasicanis TaxID=1448267 RepID=A0ABW1QF90_9CORY
MSHIEAREFGVRVGGDELLSALNFLCRAGAVTAIVGPSGCGKTSLLNAMSGLYPHTSGALLIDGDDSVGWSAARWRRFWRDRASFVHQNYGVIPDRNVGFNISLTTSGDRSRMCQALEAVSLEVPLTARAGILSGGEQQRVGIARAIYKSSQFVFADEPTASLDRVNREHVISLLRTLAREGRTVVTATHDEDLMKAADQVISL